MNHVLFLVDQPIDQRNFDRFGVQTWIDRGWTVEIWDLTPIVYPAVWQQHLQWGGKLKQFQGYIPISSKRELWRRHCELKNTHHFIDFTGSYFLSARIKARLIRRGVARVVCANGAIPIPARRTKGKFASKVRWAVSIGPARATKMLISALVQQLAAAFIKPGLVVVSGTNTIPAVFDGHAPEIVRAHNLDYDLYLKTRKPGTAPEGKFIAFLDQDYCFHPEYIYQGVPRVVTPDKYFPAVCNALKMMSRTLRMDVRVAAHPRAAYRYRDRDYFGGIPVEYGDTAELIRDCKVAVCHDSTVIQLAVLFGKPVIFVTTDQLDLLQFDNIRKGEVISHFASELGKSVINLDRDLNQINWHQELCVDASKYAEYKRKYIKIDGSGELPYWEIVSRHLENR